MRKFLYRLTWDKEIRNKTLLITGSALCFLTICVLAFPICGQAINELKNNENEEQVEAEDNVGPKFLLEFGEKKKACERETNHKDCEQENCDNDNKENNLATNKEQSSPSTNEHQSSSVGSNENHVHVHNWITVVDQAAWTENVRVQVGCSYRCNNCGFTTNNSGDMRNHCFKCSHSFSSSPIYEDRQIYHPGCTHQECSCGARK